MKRKQKVFIIIGFENEDISRKIMWQQEKTRLFVSKMFLKNPKTVSTKGLA